MFKRVVVVFGLIMCLVVLVGGGVLADELKVLTWQGYISPEVIEQFESTYGTKLVITDYLSLDVMKEHLYNDPGSYDLVITAGWVVPELLEDNMLEPLDKTMLKNFKNIHPWFVDLPFDKGNNYTVPYIYAFFGLAYNKNTISADAVTLKNLFETEDALKNRVTFYPDVRCMVGLALKYMGKSANSTESADLELAKMLLSNLKANCIDGAWDLSRTVVDPGIAIVQGQADMAMFYANKKFVQNFLGLPEDLEFVMPEEGGIIASDNMMIAKNAVNKEMAYKFIDFILTAEIAAKQVAFVGLPMPVIGVEELLDPALANDPTMYPPASLLKKFEFLNIGTPELMNMYKNLWNEVK